MSFGPARQMIKKHLFPVGREIVPREDFDKGGRLMAYLLDLYSCVLVFGFLCFLLVRIGKS